MKTNISSVPVAVAVAPPTPRSVPRKNAHASSAMMHHFWTTFAAAALVLLTAPVAVRPLVGNHSFLAGVAEAFTASTSFSGRKQRQQFHTVTAPLAAADPFENYDEDEIINGGSADDYFPPKIMDGLKFNLFGIGRLSDEDENGAFTPPVNSMIGKVVVITGASSGLGLESAKRLSLAGATVVLTARTEEKVQMSVDAVRDYYRTVASTSKSSMMAEPVVAGITLDLDDFSSSVRSFPDRYRECMLQLSKSHDVNKSKKIDVLMNNAGGGGYPSRELTVDGFERTFQSCHLGHFLMTARLFEEDLLNDEAGCTVISVSSVSHKSAEASHIKKNEGGDDVQPELKKDMEYGFDFDNVYSEVAYSGEAYFQGKVANVLFTKELQRRADEHLRTDAGESWLTAVSLEPGGVSTDIWRHVLGYDPRTFEERSKKDKTMVQPKDRTWADKLKSRVFYTITTQVDRGANAQIWLAHAAVTDCGGAIIRGGQHYDEYRTPRPVPDFADNEDICTRLWELSEEMAGIKFDL